MFKENLKLFEWVQVLLLLIEWNNFCGKNELTSYDITDSESVYFEFETEKRRRYSEILSIEHTS